MLSNTPCSVIPLCPYWVLLLRFINNTFGAKFPNFSSVLYPNFQLNLSTGIREGENGGDFCRSRGKGTFLDAMVGILHRKSDMGGIQERGIEVISTNSG